MDLPKVRTAKQEEKQKVLETATLAFCTDPSSRWLFRHAGDFLKNSPTFFDMYACSESIKKGNTYVTEGLEGISIWLAPNSSTDEKAIENWVEQNLDHELQDDMTKLFEEIDKYHPKDIPIWYLAILGVDPYHQRKGLGSVLLKHVTGMLDDEKKVGYLESSNPQNISLYLRHGFEVMGEIQVGSSPVITPMIRNPQ